MESTNYSRKDFLKLMVWAASLTFSGCSGWEKIQRKERYAPIAFQLYTVRREIWKDLEGTMHKLVDIGFIGLRPMHAGNITLLKHKGL